VIEIERKFLVSNIEDCLRHHVKSIDIVQGYLSFDSARSIRIRKTDKKAYITIKGKSNKAGDTRFEWDKEITKNEATQLFALSLGQIIKKKRYIVPHNSHLFEVDVFSKPFEGLVVAEVELSAANEHLELPKWIGEEVTGDIRYYNSDLAKKGLKPEII
jgi:adenylate cyclase